MSLEKLQKICYCLFSSCLGLAAAVPASKSAAVTTASTHSSPARQQSDSKEYNPERRSEKQCPDGTRRRSRRPWMRLTSMGGKYTVDDLGKLTRTNLICIFNPCFFFWLGRVWDAGQRTQCYIPQQSAEFILRNTKRVFVSANLLKPLHWIALSRIRATAMTSAP